jgi:hypothetical protein
VFKGPQKPLPGPSPQLYLSDGELLDRARQAANGEKISLLLAGNWQGNYSSQSEADLALCEMLAFWTGKDATRMDRIFRGSGLYREKWNRLDYRERTINKAIENTTEVYKKPQAPARSPQKPPARPAPAPRKATPPAFPQEAITGAAGRFARGYAAYLEAPPEFLFMAYLTVLGHIVSDKITLKSEITPQPRLYTVLLGESADTRKSTAINKVVSFFKDVVYQDDLNIVHGVSSGEGLAKCIKKNNRVLLVSDELKALNQKMKIDTSILLPMVNTLFEGNIFHGTTKSKEIRYEDAQLCLLAASTLDTYANMFTGTFLDIGFINRLFLVAGNSDRRFELPQVMPDSEKEILKADVRDLLTLVDSLALGAVYGFPITEEARKLFANWYFDGERSAFAKRLDTYGHRLLMLLALNAGKPTVDAEVASLTVSLLRYQLAVRKFADPVDGDNAAAKVEERIRRALAQGPLKKRDLERACNKNRVGSWVWRQAVNNLRVDGELVFYPREKVFVLSSTTSSTV